MFCSAAPSHVYFSLSWCLIGLTQVMLVLGLCYCGVSRQHNKNLLKETCELNLWNNYTGCFHGISNSIWQKSLWAMHLKLGRHSHKSIWVKFIALLLWGMALVYKFTLFVLNAVHGMKYQVEILGTHSWATSLKDYD